MAKAKKRRARKRANAAWLREGGPDPSGNYGVNPYAARGHVVEVAPKELRASATSQQFPQRTVTQRVIDRYRAHGHIATEEWRAANALWEFHCDAERIAKTTSGYDPVMVQSSPSMDGRLAKYLDGALGFVRMMKAVPYHSQGVVRAVVIDDQLASDWARARGYGDRDSERLGMVRLRAGLQALAHSLGY